MPSSRQISGTAAESLVAKDLQASGWALLKKNLRTPYAEIDLLFRDGPHSLVLVEVKARGPLCWLEGEDCLGPKQRARLLRAAEWLANRQKQSWKVRLDLALVELAAHKPVAWHLVKEIGSY